jgi:hypothetical protein
MDADEDLPLLADRIRMLLQRDGPVTDGRGAHGAVVSSGGPELADPAEKIRSGASAVWFPVNVCVRKARTRVLRRVNELPPALLHVASGLHLPHVPPIHLEGRVGFEAAGLVRDPVWRGYGVPRGEGARCC